MSNEIAQEVTEGLPLRKESQVLVLSRQRDEAIVIDLGDRVIEVYVVDIRGDKVRLGFEAPADVPIHRKEVYEAIQRENRALANLKPEDLPPASKGGPQAAQPSERGTPPAQRPPAPGLTQPPTPPSGAGRGFRGRPRRRRW